MQDASIKVPSTLLLPYCLQLVAQLVALQRPYHAMNLLLLATKEKLGYRQLASSKKKLGCLQLDSLPCGPSRAFSRGKLSVVNT